MTSSCPIVKIFAEGSCSSPHGILLVSGSRIYSLNSENEKVSICFQHPEGKRWSSVAALAQDGHLAICDTEKRLFLLKPVNRDQFSFQYEVVGGGLSMHLAKTATSVKFTDFPIKNTLLVADKFGDVLRFEGVEEFTCWAEESQKNSKSLSIHTHGKRKLSSAEGEEAAEGVEDQDQRPHPASDNEAHHCTIIGHISMITDLQVLPGPDGGLILTGDRDEKVRLTHSNVPESIHSFALAHRQYVATIAVCPKANSFFAAGGDDYCTEWSVTGASEANSSMGDLKLKSKIPVSGPVREVKIDEDGEKLYILLDESDLICYERESESAEQWTWKLAATYSGKITAFDVSSSGNPIIAYWTEENGTELSLSASSPSCLKEQLEAVVIEEAREAVDSLSKKKFRKDIERMDWQLKKKQHNKEVEVK